MIKFSLGIKNEMKHPILFPSDLCCNCGTEKDVSIINQDTRVTKFFGAAGTESTFSFSLPFCKPCEISSRRHPKTLFHRALLFGIIFGGLPP